MNNTINNEAIWGKLSEMDKKLSKIESRQPLERPFIEPIQVPNEPILDKLQEIEQTLAKPSVKKHHHSIEITSSWVFLSLIGLSLGLLLSLFFHYKQRERIGKLSDNDLKYRFIKAANQTDSLKISELENIFEINRNEESIKIIRKRIENHERAVVKRAEDLERARWKEEEAERLKKEAEELRE